LTTLDAGRVWGSHTKVRWDRVSEFEWRGGAVVW